MKPADTAVVKRIAVPVWLLYKKVPVGIVLSEKHLYLL